MVVSNSLRRTFQLRFNGNCGTCFAVDIEKKQYVCTAKHCLNGFDGGHLELFHDGAWKSFDAKLVGHGSNETDIAVIALEAQITPTCVLPLKLNHKGAYVGQEMHFVGFPYGLRMDYGELNSQFPLPLVKRATLSAMYVGEPRERFYLDGHNNSGFSGGPVVFIPPGMERQPSVAAIISSYRFHPEHVYLGPFSTPLTVRENTGIIIAFAINHALDAINDNPIGCEIN